MNVKQALAGATAAVALALAGPASADVLTGQVYQLTDGDIYLRQADSTVVRIPMETASFKVNGAVVPGNSLVRGQTVVADYTPVYGFQRFYNTSTAVDGVRTVYLLEDVDLADVNHLEWDGRVYLIKR